MPIITPEILRSGNAEQAEAAARARWDSVPVLSRKTVLAEEIRQLPMYEAMVDRWERVANQAGARGQNLQNVVAQARIQINRAVNVVRQVARDEGIDVGLSGATSWVAALTPGAVLTIAGALLFLGVIATGPLAVFLGAVMILAGLLVMGAGIFAYLTEPGVDPSGNPTPAPIDRFASSGISGLLIVGGLLLAAFLVLKRRAA